MLISHKHKFITIDIPKTGTRSMRISLEPLGILDIIGGPHSTKDNPFEQHGSAISAKKQFNQNKWNWQEYYKWIIVRNPWARYFSFFKYFKSYGEKYLKQDKSIIWGPVQLNQGKICVNLFKNKSTKQTFKSIILAQESQDTYYLDEQDEIIVDHIAKFENLSIEFSQFCDKVSVHAPPLAHGNKSSNNLLPENIYDQELIDLVAEKEKSVIKLKNYHYE